MKKIGAMLVSLMSMVLCASEKSRYSFAYEKTERGYRYLVKSNGEIIGSVKNPEDLFVYNPNSIELKYLLIEVDNHNKEQRTDLDQALQASVSLINHVHTVRAESAYDQVQEVYKLFAKCVPQSADNREKNTAAVSACAGDAQKVSAFEALKKRFGESDKLVTKYHNLWLDQKKAAHLLFLVNLGLCTYLWYRGC